MKNNKLIAFVTAVTMIMSLFSGMVISVSADNTTTYTWDFTDSAYFSSGINKGSDIISDQNETTVIMRNPGAKLSPDNITGGKAAKCQDSVENTVTIAVPEGSSASISMELTHASSGVPIILRDTNGEAVITASDYTKKVLKEYTANLECGKTYTLDTSGSTYRAYLGKIVLTVTEAGGTEPQESEQPQETSPAATATATAPAATATATAPAATATATAPAATATATAPAATAMATAPAATATATTEPSDELEKMTYKMQFNFANYNGSTYTSPALLKNEDGDLCMRVYATSAKNVIVGSSSKTINGTAYKFRLRMNGNGSVEQGYRYVEVIPAKAGSLTVDFGHSGTSGAERYLYMQQGETTEQAAVAASATATARFIVAANTPVYLYGSGDIGFYGIKYTPGDTATPPPSTKIEDPEEAAKADAAALKINSISQNSVYFDLDLPKIGENDSEITWESSNSKYIDIQMVSSIKRNYTGVVTRPESGDSNIVDGGVPVTLTATVKNGDKTEKKEFEVSVRTRNPNVYFNDFQQDVGKSAEGTYKEISDNVVPATTKEYEQKYGGNETWRSAPFRGIRVDTLKDSRAFADFEHNDTDTSAFFDKRVMSTKGTNYGNPRDSEAENENFVFYYSEYTPYGGSSTIPLWIKLTDQNTGSAPEGIVMMSMDVYIINGYNQFNIGLANSAPAQMCRFMLGANHNKTFNVSDGTTYAGAGYLRCFNNEASVDFRGGDAGYRCPEGKWVKAIMVANTDSHKWDVYYDGMQIATSLDFRNAQDMVSNIEFVLNRSYPRAANGDPVAAYLLDNIYVENLTEDYAKSYWDNVEIDTLDYDEKADAYVAEAGQPFLLQYQGTDGLSGNTISWVSSDKKALAITTQRVPVEELANYGYSEAQIAQYNAAGVKDVSVVKATPGNVSKDTTVTLRATIKVGEDSLEKEFPVLVKASAAAPTATPKTTGNNSAGGGGGGSSSLTKTTTSTGTSGTAIASGNETVVTPALAAEPAAVTPVADSVNDYSDDVFSDLFITEWARDSIMYLYGKDVVNGYGDGTYGVEDDVTREQFVRMLLTALDIPIYKNEQPAFADVEQDSWYEYYVETALKLGIVSGISATEFGTGMPITRQDMAVMAQRALDYINGEETVKSEKITEPEETAEPEETTAPEATAEHEVSEAEENPAENTADAEEVIEKPDFSDVNEISDYALKAVAAMVKAGFLSGYEDGSFRPRNTSTRAETAVMISRIMRRINSDD